MTTVAVSVGPPPTHKVWSAAQGFLFPILSDFWPHGDVARSYGVFSEGRGYADRGTFLVDTDGSIAFADVVGPGEARSEALWDKRSPPSDSTVTAPLATSGAPSLDQVVARLGLRQK